VPTEQHRRRKFPRYNVNIVLIVYLNSETIKSKITNLCRVGCLVYPPLPALPSSELKLSFLLPDGSSRINCKGKMIYSIVNRGTGIAFTEISLYHQERIAEFFKKQPKG
jgi:hypothetical protein